MVIERKTLRVRQVRRKLNLEETIEEVHMTMEKSQRKREINFVYHIQGAMDILSFKLHKKENNMDISF